MRLTSGSSVSQVKALRWRREFCYGRPQSSQVILVFSEHGRCPTGI
jgi:hypothetical protein